MARSEHPRWCVGAAGGCVDEPGHRSAELVVPGNGMSGIGATAALWSCDGGQLFVELRLRHFPECSGTSSEPRYYVALPSHATEQSSLEAASPSVAILEEDSDEGLDFLPHDFTID